jgi:hypothetical protein
MATLVRLGWDPNWVGAIGQWAGAIGTVAAVIVALWLPQWERKKAAAERLKQQLEQQLRNARLVTIAVSKQHDFVKSSTTATYPCISLRSPR